MPGVWDSVSSCEWMAESTVGGRRTFISAFTGAISHIIRLRTSEEMVGVAAGRVVAPMQYEQSGRNASSGLVKGYAGRQERFSAYVEAPVAVFICRAYPLPTTISKTLLLYKTPETD